jgi:uncharacterized protein
MIRMAVVVAAIVLAPFSSPARAAEAPARPTEKGPGGGEPAAKPPPQARDLAQALTTRETWEEILDAYTASLAGQMAAALAATGNEPPADLREKVRKDLGDAVRYEEALDLQARALAGRFSGNELRELARFYQSGPGRKLLDVLPEVSAQVNDDLQERVSRHVPGIVERHAPALARGAEEKGASGEGTGAADREAQDRAAPDAGGAQGR